VVLREAVEVTLAGVGLGVVAASLLTWLMISLLFGTSPLDAVSFSLGPAARHGQCCGIRRSRSARRIDRSCKGLARRMIMS
jgi:hypothetical protein